MKPAFRLSANISMLFADLPFPERIAAAADAGFRAVECQFPYEFSAAGLAERCAARGLVMNGINTPMGDPARGEFGFAALPGRRADFRAGFERAMEYGQRLGVSTIHVMSGAPDADEKARARDVFLENLAWASDSARGSAVTLLIEPLNSRDRPGYFVSRSGEVVELLGALGRDNVKLLFDIYHIQIMEGDLIAGIGRCWPFIGHVQIASVPGRHEPDEGEVAFAAVLGEFTARGWAGFVGAEYNPRGGAAEGLGWARPWLAP